MIALIGGLVSGCLFENKPGKLNYQSTEIVLL